MLTLEKMHWLTRPHMFDNTLMLALAMPRIEVEPPKPEYYQPEGLVIGYTGRRRRGKSLSLVTIAKMMLDIYKYPVLANFWCSFATGLPDAKTEGLYTGRFTLEEIVALPDELHDCVILWDEIDRVFLSKRSTTLISEMLENGLNLLGKRNIWFFWGAQNIRRINSSLFWQTDLLFECDSRDKGYSVPMTMTDLHGAFGEPGTQVFRILRDTWRHKHQYNTREMFDPMERLSVRINRSQKGATPPGEERLPDDVFMGV